MSGVKKILAGFFILFAGTAAGSEAQGPRTLSAIMGETQSLTETMQKITKASTYEEVVARIEEKLALKPDARGYIMLGLVHDENTQPEKAEAAFKEAVKLSPEKSDGYQSLGLLYGKEGNSESAEENFMQAVKLDPSSISAIHNLATEFMVVGNDPAQAAVYYRMAVKADPENLARQAKLAQAHYVAKQYKEAEAVLLNVLKKDPDHAAAKQLMALIDRN